MVSILLIEDDLNCARLVQKVLAPHDHKVLHAANGLTGLRAARELSSALVLVDMDLPDLNGRAVVVQLRSILREVNVPIVAFTAESGTRAQRIALAVGCDDFISKPIDTREFPARIHAILERVGIKDQTIAARVSR
ncbi:MAG: response regulator [Anaerolineae bacterium]|nr:response regulator [Anaerolineae bacterium]